MIDICVYRIRIGSFMGSFSANSIFRFIKGKGSWERGMRFGADTRSKQFEESLIFNRTSSSKSLIFYIFSIFLILALSISSLIITSLIKSSTDDTRRYRFLQPSLPFLRGDCMKNLLMLFTKKRVTTVQGCNFCAEIE